MPTALIILMIVGFIYLLPIDKLLQDDPKNAPAATPTKSLTEEYPRDIVVIGKVTKNNVSNLELNLATKNGDFIINYGNFSDICKNNKISSNGKSINKNESIEVYGSFDGSTINTCLDNRYYISKEFCGDSICQEIACTTIGCPNPETIESCPADCVKNPEKIYSIGELKKSVSIGQLFQVRGYVVKKYTCPPCPPDAQCKACMEPHIIIMNTKETLITYKPDPKNLLIYVKDPSLFNEIQEYLFTVRILNKFTTGDSIPDIELISHSNYIHFDQ